MPTEGEQYWRDADGLWVENVGPWVKEKHKILADYVQICSATRKNYAHCCFIDPFCGPGKAKIRDTGEMIDGSAILAYRQAHSGGAPFSQILISDLDDELRDSCDERLRRVGAQPIVTPGPASIAAPLIVQRVDPYGLHLAILDPHNLGALSFDLFEALARLKRIDIIVHVSLGDLQRNLDRYTADDHAEFDRFAPGWREHVGTDMNQQALRAAIIEYWTKKVEGLGLPRAEHCELIRGTRRQRLYWLMLLARHPLAHNFWNKISSEARAPGLGL